MIELQCIVVTPERTVLECEADFVALTLYDGEIGIASGRAPLVGRLGDGEMRLLSERGLERYYVEGGFVEVSGDVVTVFTSRAVPAAELKEPIVREELEAARSKPAATPEQFAARDRLVAQHRAKLRVSRRAR